ncbi:MAG: hypothetical protein J5687_02175 [Treponema sp.]|nr:hypothetical protein [Treponema sp.]
MKIIKSLFISIIVLSLTNYSFADSFTDIIQDLATQTACIGTYSATQAGGGWYDDPYDYYTPDMMAERFKNMSGNMTRTITFYGVCFDYAEFAYWDIDDYISLYNKEGMRESQYFLAGVDSDPNMITLSRPSDYQNHTTIQNGVYIETYGSSSYRNVKTHKMTNGTRATHHAWLWIMRNDGVWFWIDPTWTDNLGYVVYGYVDNGEEIQLRPDKELCINYPNYLYDLPLPPKWGKELAPSKSTTASSSNATSTTSSSSNSANNSSSATIYLGVGYIGPLSFEESEKTNSISFFNFSKCGFELSSESGGVFETFFVVAAFDYLIDHTNNKSVDSWLTGLYWGYALLPIFEPYIGSCIGMKWNDTFSSENIGFAWKLNCGFRIELDSICLRADLSYGTILGVTGTIVIGLSYF